MTLLSLIAATFTFTATATGVEKGAPVEFAFVSNGSDRDYEAMFLVDCSADEFCRKAEAAGIPRGKPEDVRTCTMWPVGCTVELKPSLSDFIETKLPNGETLDPLVYTGGSRFSSGSCEASTNMPLAVLSFYSLSQSPLVFASHYDQSAVYNSHFARKSLKKGTKVNFTLSCEEHSMPRPLSLVARPGGSKELVSKIKTAAENNEVDVCVDFSPELTFSESVALANALSVIDSRRVKINGCRPGHLFYRAFLPAVKWRDRQERIVQPFELTVSPTNSLVYVDADWSGEGLDPKLTPRSISFDQARQYKDTDTCFIFASPDTHLSKIYDAMSLLKDSSVRIWYLFER